jgi:Ca-activated chloride channel family protein
MSWLIEWLKQPFLKPLFLVLLVVPAALLVWLHKRRSGEVVLPLDQARGGDGKAWRFFLNRAAALPALLLFVAILLLAGPQQVGEPQVKRKMTNIEICLDISGSMTAPFGDGNRYDGAMKAVEAFLDYRKGDAVGLTFFGHSFLHWCPLTADTSAVKCSTPFMRPEKVPEWFGGTEIGRALRGCKQVLAQRQDGGDRMILLVTDGMSIDLFGDAAEAIRDELKRENITVFAIIIGMESIQDEVITMTHGTGGEAFMAADTDALAAMFKKIDQMNQPPMEKRLADTFDWTAPFCIAGLIVLGLALVASYGLREVPW